ncbi:hypothetical protein FGIG_04190 [Fasciola gigantica]|uniref:Ribonuclease P protein subunit p29 n=1 Tax=Fasciola gigantica TaxID=46835 RepID=A0A504YQ05_FASGI|nr:hypothetical protein FGIG_04190 [Fasciola gigantica]
MASRSSTSTAKDDTVDGTVAISEFVRQFVRRHVAPGRRVQADLALQPGGKSSATSHNLSLIPQSTRILRAQTNKSRRRSIGGTIRLLRPKRTRNMRAKTDVTLNGSLRSREVPASLGQDLHALWLGYARTMVDWSRIATQAKHTPVSNANLTDHLETALRMSLVGARLLIMRSTSVPLAGRSGIVIMETKNVFRMVLLDSNEAAQECTSTAPNATTGSLTLRSIPKQGTLFLLILDTLISGSGLLFSGDHLKHRSVDRAVRKWRRPVLSLPALGDHLPSTAEMAVELCSQPFV